MSRIEVLDHGYVSLVESWGSDERIIEAARMSTNKGFKGWGGNCATCAGSGLLYFQANDGSTFKDECGNCLGTGKVSGDEKLLRYLYKNHHMTPFEMAGAIFEIQAPIFVFREWHRHRTQSYNEMSARYTPLPNVNYVPTQERCLASSATNKQAAALNPATPEGVDDWLQRLSNFYEMAETLYQNGLTAGIPKEIARIPLPVGRYSRMRASANLRNWLGFLTLRMDPSAQWEIRVYADIICAQLAQLFPRTLELFNE